MLSLSVIEISQREWKEINEWILKQTHIKMGM